MMIRDRLTGRQQRLLNAVKVNAPLTMLRQGLLEEFIENRINPEIGLDAESLLNVSDRELDRIAGDIRKAGLKPTVHGPFMDLSGGAVDPGVLELSRSRFRLALDRAACFSPEHIVFHPCFDFTRYGAMKDRWLETSLETWGDLAARASSLGIRLVLENTYERGPRELLALFRNLAPAGVGFCFDIGHASSFGKAPVREWLDMLSPYLDALHLHDNDGGGDQHRAIGQGTIDFEAFFGWLDQHGVQPKTITLEPHEKDQVEPGLVALSALWPWDLDG